ncbi:MAG: PLP-dependent transferase [Planctomycetota bacterium]
MKFETRAILGQRAENSSNAIVEPIQLSTTFSRASDGNFRDDAHVYSRMSNPNRDAFERIMAHLEHGERALAFASGMAAIDTIFRNLKPGEHLLLPEDVFFATLQLAHATLIPQGVEVSTVNMASLTKVEKAIRPNTSLIWLESPSNPRLGICDIAALADLSQKRGILCGVDNTWATPVLTNPLLLGADLVMHSTTKYLGGHSDVLGGCLVFKREDHLFNKAQQIQRLAGAVASPIDCWLVKRGIKTLHLRVKHQSANALRIANELEAMSAIEKVHYPGLPSHPQHEFASRQMSGGFGGMLSIQVRGGEEAAMKVVAQSRLFTAATSLGGVESLIEHRKSVEGPDSETPDNLLRISVGIENVNDLIDDLGAATSTLSN